MNGFYLSIGKQGSGKTLFMTKMLHTEMDDRTIFSNYTLFGLDYERITFDRDQDGQDDAIDILDKLDEDPNYFNDSIMLLDEIHIYFDSLDFMKRNNRRMHTFFSQLRKRNILLFATTQYLMNLDVRIRRQCLNVFEMEHIYKGLFEVVTHEIDGYYSIEISRYRVDLSDYFDLYDTNEIIR
jgi:GTPase SAR1 family protein